jgi:integrase
MQRVQLDKGAWIYKPNGCPIWHLDLSVAGRPRRRVSLHTQNKDHALSLARPLIQDALSERWGVALPTDLSFASFRETYRIHAATRNTPATLTLNLANLDRFLAFLRRRLGARRDVMLSDVCPETIEVYLAERKNAGVKPATINRELATLSVFFNLAKERNHVRSNPAERVRPLPIVRNRLPKTLDPDQVSKLLAQAALPIPCVGRGGKGRGNTRSRRTPLYDMILFTANTGTRLGELLYLEWEDVDLQQGIVSFRCKPEHQIKDREERRFCVNGAVLDMLRRRRLAAGACRWVFPSIVGTPLQREHALREFKAIAQRAEVSWANWQVLRRTFATECAKSGVPAFILKAVLGHTSVSTTERYYIGIAGTSKWVPPVIGAQRMS